MGSLLDTPQTHKDSVRAEGNGLRCCATGMQGWRAEMEVRQGGVVVASCPVVRAAHATVCRAPFSSARRTRTCAWPRCPSTPATVSSPYSMGTAGKPLQSPRACPDSGYVSIRVCLSVCLFVCLCLCRLRVYVCVLLVVSIGRARSLSPTLDRQGLQKQPRASVAATCAVPARVE